MVSPSYWSRPGARTGRPRRVSLRRSACGCSSARLLVLPPLRPPRWMCLTGCECRKLPWTHSATRCSALLTGVGTSHALVGPVPLWCGGLHAAAVRHASRRMDALPPSTGPSRAHGGADPAVFRPTQGRGRARPHQARAWGYSPQSSWPAPCPGTCLYSAYGDIMKRYAQK